MSAVNSYAVSDEVLDVIFREARTANTFTDEPVTEAQLRDLYELVKCAPTAMNLQSLRIVFVQPGEKRDQLVTHMSDNNKPKTASAPMVAILAADVDFHEHLERVFPHFPGAKNMYSDASRREVMARSQAWLQAGFFIAAVRTLGLAAGPMLGFNADSLDEDFFAGTSLKSICVINLGKPGVDAWREPRLPRLDFAEAVSIV